MSRNVLVIEDDLDIAPLLTIQLTELTCTVMLAPGASWDWPRLKQISMTSLLKEDAIRREKLRNYLEGAAKQSERLGKLIP
ncbi:MAG: hypothetical protein ABIP64_11195, partial [Burkholderiales bacterium]